MSLHPVHVLCCFALFICLTLLASFFLPSLVLITQVHVLYWRKCTCVYTSITTIAVVQQAVCECAGVQWQGSGGHQRILV